MEYIGHTRDDGEIQSLKEHLENVAKMAEDFALPPFKAPLFFMGNAHDIGKYGGNFQLRMRGNTTVHPEHAIFGAKWVYEHNPDEPFSHMFEFCIAGHHTGLCDGYDNSMEKENPTLVNKLNKTYDEDYSDFSKEIKLEYPDTKDMMNLLISDKPTDSEIIERYAFFTRYAFSCLTDSDFIDTENFCSKGKAQRGLSGDFKSALDKLNKVLDNFTADTKVKKARAELAEQAYKSAENSTHISLLNMPTGSGKTLCSAKIALKKALAGGKKRIIYVIPYTSIIEQTANVFNNIFGDSLYVLQHHSNYSFEDDKDKANDEETTAKKLKRTCENWDAPFIVTTNVQFFQSLYHNKSSRLRKLHNLADSVIIFDEIHMLPIEYIQPCLRAVGYITKYLNSEAVFLSATMPNYDEMFSRYLPECSVNQLITDKSSFENFKNCTYENIGKVDEEKLLMTADKFKSCLTIVNSRKNAQKLYSQCSGKKYHLSTYMTPVHRSRVINEIKACLADENDEKIIVVSTSLVEAGVDFDFEAVFRELAGLDSILQSGGRCNREGKRSEGRVFVFEYGDSNGDVKARGSITRAMMKENNNNISTPECAEDYYHRLFQSKDETIEKNCISKFNGEIKRVEHIHFRTYAEKFKFIDSDAIGFVVNNCDEADKLLIRLKNGDLSAKRELQKYSVSVYYNEFQSMAEMGIIKEYAYGVFMLTNNDYYDNEMGIDTNKNLSVNYIE